MFVRAGDVRLWFDVSGPALIPDGDSVRERSTVVAVHGGPGINHLSLKNALAPLATSVQIVSYDQRGHGRSDSSTPGHWNLPTWAADLRSLCDTLGLDHPIVLGSSFGGFVALVYAGLFPEHPGGVILANTTGGRSDHRRSVEIFRRLGGDEVAAAAERDFTDMTRESSADFNRLCYPLFSARPGLGEQSMYSPPASVQGVDVNLHYWRNEAPWYDSWTLLPAIRCPVLVLAGDDDPICPIEVVQDLANRLPAGSTRLVRLPNARHTIFRDQPQLAFTAIHEFVASVTSDHPSQY